MNKQIQDLYNKVLKVLGPGGIIPTIIPGYELRPQQMRMALAVCEAVITGENLLVEAATGIGKGLAYLTAPTINAVERDKTVVISTHTKTLQEQLFLKDLPLLQKALMAIGIEFRYALCLGSGNYTCLRRLYSEYTYELLESENKLDDLSKIKEWVKTTQTGIKSDLGYIPKNIVWEHVCREPDLCIRKCDYASGCFYKKAKEEQQNAHVLVVNHALLAIDITSDGHVIPNCDVVIIDEAHTFEGVVTDYLGIKLSTIRIKSFFDAICNSKTGHGILAKVKNKKAKKQINIIRQRIEEARAAFNQFTAGLSETFGVKTDTKRIRTPGIVFNYMDEPLSGLKDALGGLLDFVRGEENISPIKALLKRCVDIKAQLSFILNLKEEEYVYWADVEAKRYGIKYTLCACPIEVAQELRERLFNRIRPVIATSATLATHGNFGFIKKRLGIGDCTELILGSPFDFQKNAMILLPKGMPDPSNKAMFQNQVVDRVKGMIDIMGGRIFVLFTSYRMLDYVAIDLKAYYKNIVILRHGEKPRYELLEEFKKNPNSVLLGTNTFWQGIDVPGRALESVIIVKLPFSVPDNPVMEARLELIKARNGNPFVEYQLPQAIAMFRQGFGRLIRTNTDRGVVAVLDPRIMSKGYGKLFLNSVPKCRHTADINDVKSFFNVESTQGSEVTIT